MAGRCASQACSTEGPPSLLSFHSLRAVHVCLVKTLGRTAFKSASYCANEACRFGAAGSVGHGRTSATLAVPFFCNVLIAKKGLAHGASRAWRNSSKRYVLSC